MGLLEDHVAAEGTINDEFGPKFFKACLPMVLKWTLGGLREDWASRTRSGVIGAAHRLPPSLERDVHPLPPSATPRTASGGSPTPTIRDPLSFHLLPPAVCRLEARNITLRGAGRVAEKVEQILQLLI
ncbi:protein kinase superfamily protein [Striga asiatica]|uniref:Protein kinase superfamily protein n=1 Tax=Striga asiatica TaxID=4170 RepID=A0A5A7PTP5_STRAF|nr:protein kinase superfamily protein [Striga asiatica]